MKIKQEI